jgi:hypothetical protein
MRSRVGILTLYDAFNYGAFLQAYAMQKLVRSLGYDVHFIQSNGVSKKYFLNVLKHRKAWWKFYGIRNYLKLKQAWEKLDIASTSAPGNYETVIIGSDEVWSIRNDQFEHLPEHFSLGVKATKVIAYGPSFGSTKLEDVESNNQIKKGLQSFSSISARDINTQNIVRILTSREAPLVCDPTLLVDFDEIQPVKTPEHYIFVYFLGNDPEHIRKIVEYSKKVKKPLIAAGLGNFHFWCDQFIVATPFEFLSLIKNADTIATNTFHGTILSIKFQKEFFAFTKNRPKVQMALSMYGLEKRDCSSTEISDVLSSAIDYSNVNEIINLQKQESLAYLTDALAVQ